MENDNKGCCDDAEYKEVEESGCGCGCGSISVDVDESLVDNPEKPQYIADDNFFEKLEKYAHSIGIKSIGYTQVTPDLLIEDKFIQYPNTIVLTMEMSKEIIETPPGPEALELNNAAYEKLGKLTYKISDYLRENGFATQVAHPFGNLVNFSPLAQKAGMGHIGKNGLLITPELGPRQKISAIFVSIAKLPLKDDNLHTWIPEYCEICGKCIKACPEEALIETETCCSGKQVEFIQKLCIGCSQGCTYCIEACPFDEKGYDEVKNKFDKINAKLRKKQIKNFNITLWENWVGENSSLFTGLVNGAVVAMSMVENDERIILLEKKDTDLKVSIKDPNVLERPVADLMFGMDAKAMAKILKDSNSIKFIELLSSGKIQIYALLDQLELMDKGYTSFLNRLGFKLGGGGCCG
ncbi:MAG: 4Fe-4S binding protein [Methanobacteriaceae archaeon]|nr:4Fe-4S binding protein [Methanobacteriaceae archaeon]